jgi:diguanylate cyclase (GGDEF)-like protein
MDVLREAIYDPETMTVAIAMVDVDGLKVANDTYGHPMGDAVLVRVADELSRGCAIVGRYGGDEFIAVLDGADRAGAEAYRDDILASLRDASLIDPQTGASVPVVVSIGLAIYPEEAGAVDDLIRLSDSAMYAARRRRNDAREQTLARTLGGDRAARMVGELVPLLTSPGAIDDKLRLVAHRLSVGAGYDAVHFILGGARPETRSSSAFARVPAADLDRFNEAQRSELNDKIARLLQDTKRPIIIDELADNDLIAAPMRDGLLAAGFHAVLIAPMLMEDELIGALSVGSKQPGAFSVRDAEFVMAVATQVTAIVQMSRLLERLHRSSARLRRAHEETVLMLASAAEAHDHTTGRHLARVRDISEALAIELGYSPEDAHALGLAATLHDIGKVRVPDSVLGSSSALADAEWALMRQHTLWGAAFLSGQQGFELAAIVARHHHERWDGGGYPDRLSGDDIPEAAQIITVADSLDAMTNDRPYRVGRPVSQAVAEIVRCSGTQFSPRVVDALVGIYGRGDLDFVRDHPHDQARRAA